MRIGVVGTGFGSRVVAGAFRDAGCEVVDVVTARDPASVRGLCRSRIDLVTIHSPPFLHREHVTWALDAGRAVLCDKPFGLSVDDASAMTEAAEACRAPNFVNFEFRHQPARRAMSELISSGAIGGPAHLSYTSFTSGSRDPLRPWGWLFDRSRGGGWIGAFGSHAVDLMRWLLGEIVRAGATSWITVAERPDAEGGMHRCDAEDSFAGWIEAESGATGSVDSSSTAGTPATPRIVVVGSEGVIENSGDRRLLIRRRGEPPEELTFEPGRGDAHSEAMVSWAAAVRDSVLTGRPIAPAFCDGLACMRVMEQWRGADPRGVGEGRSQPGQTTAAGGGMVESGLRQSTET